MTVHEWIVKNQLTPTERDPHLWTGHHWLSLFDGNSDRLLWPEGGIWQERWSNGFREVYIYPQARAVLTYCEGDLNATVDPTEEAFQMRVDHAATFYNAPADLGVKA